MCSRILILLVSLLLIVQVNSVGAVMLVDTGPGPSTGPGAYFGLAFSILSQSLGAEFELTTDATITDIDGWISTINSGPALLGIYSDGGNIPGTILFSDTFTIGGNPGYTWQGLSNLDWFLPSGTYWVTFEAIPGQATAGTINYPAVSPLGRETYRNYPDSWQPLTTMGFGVRIEGVEGTPVPEPSTFILLGAGLAGLVVWRKKRS